MVPDKIEPIAIIGLSVKFPQDATCADSFWDMLREGRSAASKAPADRFNVDAFHHPDPNRLDSLRVRDGHFMQEDPRAFDAPFFNMSPAEASVLDPQQRGLLEGAYHCLENAGLPLTSLEGSTTSVFVACFGRDYDAFIARDVEAFSRYHATGSGSSMLANRISHAFDLRGPSITVDTACSAGLSAFHLACQSLLSGESEMALVCGGNTYLTPESLTIPLDDAGFLSPDGRCYSFDHKANGYARGEGFGCVAIKPLRLALRDGNVIRAVVRATGVNQDGKTPSITQPSSEAQISLIRKTYEMAGLTLDRTDYVEAHGTGTAVGDPIEAKAIGHVFRTHRGERGPLYVGSVKSNIGHLEGASGLAGIIKTVLVLERGEIPPVCNFEKANPAIDEEQLLLKFPTRPVPWPGSGLRRASVSSFGYGGSNGHTILEDAANYLGLRGLVGRHNSVLVHAHPSRPLSPISDTSFSSLSSSHTPESPMTPNSDTIDNAIGIMPLSASDEDGPARLAALLSSYLTSTHGNKHSLRDVLYTLSSHRTHHPWRSFAVVDGISLYNLPSAIHAAVRASHGSNPPSLRFVFTGQGAQWPRMGLGLLRYSRFRESLQAADCYLRQGLGCPWSVLVELAKTEREGSNLHTPALSQPMTTIVQVAVVDLLRSWNIIPASVCGHSSGEMAAAYCAGALTREEAWRVAYFRGVVSEKLASIPADSSISNSVPMGMMSAGLTEQEAQTYLQEEGVADQVVVGCVNSPINVTLSGAKPALDKLWERLDRDEKFVRRLNVTVAYHSRQMSEVAREYMDLLSDPRYRDSCTAEPDSIISMFSCVTGQRVSHQELRDPSYWVQNLVGKVRFSDALTSAVQSDDSGKRTQMILEIGPSSALRRPVQDTLTSTLGKDHNKWQYTPILDPKQDDATAVLSAVGRLWCSGLPIDLSLTLPKSEQDSGPRMMVDLPSYPFSRAKLYWEESRLSRKFAFRKHRRHCLLGLRARDFNPAEAQWRHMIRYSENPWILDHTLNGSSIYPGSGIIVMAIEAARQITGPEIKISGYRVADVRFLRAINVDDSEKGVEAQLHMRQRKDNINNALQKWYDWRVFQQGNGDEWLEAAHGSILVEVEKNNDTAEHAEREKRRDEKLHQQYEKVVDACKFKTYPDQMYGNMRELGLGYGPFFARLDDITYDKEGHAAASLALRDYAQKMAYAHEDPCVIHPTTLDALCHLQMAALSAGGLRPIPTMMFTHCREMWISHKLFELSGNPIMHAASNQTMRGFRECEFDTVALLAETGEPVVVIRGERGTAITSLDEHGFAEKKKPDTACYALDFRPDLGLLDNKRAYDFLMRNTFARFPLPDKDHIDRADAISIYYVESVLARLEREGLPRFGDYRDLYIEWMRRTRERRHEYIPELRGRLDLDAATMVLEPEPMEPTQRLARKVGENLYGILTGQANAMQVLFENKLVDDYYSAEMFKIHANRVGAYIEILAHKNPYLKILEIGAGTGSSAAGVLPFLVYDQGNGKELPRLSEYMYTDISAGFFEHARSRFSKYAAVMSFQKLDIEQDPLAQGFEEGAYDVIIAGNVMHATRNLHESLRWARRLLKPGGKLIMVEICNPSSVREGLIFGLLPGWWLRTELGSGCVYPEQGPLLTEKQWHEVLGDCGFSGVDLQLRDHEELPYHRLTTLVTTAVEPVQVDVALSVYPTFIVIDMDSDFQRNLADSLRSDLAATPGVVTILDASQGLSDVNLAGSNVISLLELGQDVLYHIDDKRMTIVKKLTLEPRRVLWMTGGGGPKPRRPEAELSIGLSRTVCSERGDQGVIVASLESVEDTDHCVAMITSLLNRVSNDANDMCESELAEINGVFHIPRVSPNGRLNDEIAQRTLQHQSKTCILGPNVDTHIGLTIGNPGLLDTLCFKETCLSHQGPLKEDEVEIQVMSSSLNFKDVMIALGQIPGGGFGYDGAGVITRVGPECRHAKVGERVMFVSVTGAFSTFVRVSELQTHPMPRDMPFTIAASIPVVYCTALYSLDYVARLRQGESVLIHAGAGGVGQAAVMIAKKRGAIIYVTVGSQTKRNLLINEYGIPSENIFNSRDASFVDDIMHATQGRGVDVVLNSLGGELLQQSWKCIKVFGRFVEIGKADIIQKTGLCMEPFDRNVTFSAVDLIVVVENSRELMKDVMADVMDLWTKYPEQVHEPRPLHVYPANQFEEAMRYLQSGKNTGKTVIDWSQQTEVQYRPVLKPSYQFRPDATYVLAGGLGGLPKAIVRWMMSRGARYFLLLSRSGVSQNSDGQRFIAEVSKQGATVVAPCCNIANKETLQTVLDAHAQTLPPIRGCIQGAMVLHDELVENMTSDVWNEPLESKYYGSKNLCELLPPDLDFMVLLSSFAGIIGNRGQANYAAGNTYQDALARHLVHKGQRAVSVNLGLILEAGSANSNYFFVQSTLRAGFSGVTQDQLMGLLDVVCDPNYDYNDERNAQIVHVVDSPKQLWEKGNQNVVGWMTKPLFRNLHRIGAMYEASADSSTSNGAEVDYLAQVTKAASVDEAAEVVTRGLVQKLAKSLSVPEADLDPQMPAFKVGVDSLIAVEVRYWFMKQFGVEVAVFNILKDQSMTDLCYSVAVDVLKK